MAIGKISLGSHSGYAEANSKRDEIIRKIDVASRELAELESRRKIWRSKVESALQHEAEQMLSGKSKEDNRALESLVKEKAHLIAVLKTARELQERVLCQARSEASLEICKKLKPEHDALVGRLANGLIALGNLIVEEMEFRDRFFVADVAVCAGIRPMGLLVLGDPRHLNSPISYWFKEAIEHGYIDKSDLPQDWLRP